VLVVLLGLVLAALSLGVDRISTSSLAPLPSEGVVPRGLVASAYPSPISSPAPQRSTGLTGCPPGSPICAKIPNPTSPASTLGPWLICNPPFSTGKFSASIDSTTTSGAAPWTVQLTAAVVGEGNAYSYDYAWNTGDGNSTSGSEQVACLQHTFVSPGDYIVTLTVTDISNGTKVFSQLAVNVGPVQVEAAWTELSTPHAPSPRSGAAMAYDALEGETVLFGGTGTTPTGGSPVLGDTWVFKGGIWTNITSTLTTSPPPLTGALMAYDASDGYLMLFGGSPAGTSPFGNESWAFTGSTWVPLAPLPVGINAWPALAYDSADGVIIFTGEIDQPCCSGETWSFVGDHWTLVAMMDPGFYYDPLTYDTAAGYILQMGGWNGTYQTWSLLHATWTELRPPFNPPWWMDQPLIDDPAAGGALFVTANPYSGYPTTDCPSSNCFETWAFVSTNWTNLTGIIAHSPGTLSGVASTFDATQNEPLLFGGTPEGSAKPLNNTWAFSEHSFSGPTVVATATPQSGVAPLPVNFQATASGGSPPYTYEWDFGDGSPLASGASTAHTYTQAGTFSARATVTDSAGLAAVDVVPITVTIQVGPPVISAFSATPATVEVGTPTTLQVTASGGVPPLYYNYTGLPAGCLWADTPSLSCTPTASGTFTVRVYVNDSDHMSATTTTVLTVTPTSSGPVIVAFQAVPSTLTAGTDTNLTVSAHGGTGTLSYAYTGLPPGCVSSDLASLECRPSTAGVYLVTVTVTDAVGLQASASVTLTVEQVSGGPTISSFDAAPASVATGATSVLTVVASGGTGALHFYFTGLPPGCSSLDQTSLSCTPTSPGDFTVRVYVNDTSGNSATATTLLTVTGSAIVPSAAPAAPDYGLYLGGAALAVAVLALVVAILRRRGRQPPVAPPAPTAPEKVS
jgi:PKD repeat protein